MALFEVHQWITKVPYGARVKAFEEERLEDEDLPQWTKKVIGRNWSQVLEDDEARNIIKRIMWRST